MCLCASAHSRGKLQLHVQRLWRTPKPKLSMLGLCIAATKWQELLDIAQCFQYSEVRFDEIRFFSSLFPICSMCGIYLPHFTIIYHDLPTFGSFWRPMLVYSIHGATFVFVFFETEQSGRFHLWPEALPHFLAVVLASGNYLNGGEACSKLHIISDWWFGTFFFSHIFGIILPID